MAPGHCRNYLQKWKVEREENALLSTLLMGSPHCCLQRTLCSSFSSASQIPSFYINVSNFYECLGHPKSKFQNALKNSRVEIGVYLLYTKFSIFKCTFDTIFFRIFGAVLNEKIKIYHINCTNLFIGLEFSTYPFLW